MAWPCFRTQVLEIVFLLLGIDVNIIWHHFPVQLTLVPKGLVDHMAHVAGHCTVGLLQSPFLFWVPLKVGRFLYLLVNES